MKTTITESGVTPRGMLKEQNAISREVGWQVGALWFREMMPNHFTHRGATEYGYQLRQSSYNRRKLIIHGHTYPLVFSGETRDRVLSHKFPDVRVTATSKRTNIKVVIHGAEKLNYKASANSPNMREELTKVSDNEFLQLGALAKSEYEKRYNQVSHSETRKLA
jgi:hypothetical protein